MRIRLTAPHGTVSQFRYLDSLHAAIINAWHTSGVQVEDVVGQKAGLWSFGAIGSISINGSF